jgi:hypothetical protein
MNIPFLYLLVLGSIIISFFHDVVLADESVVCFICGGDATATISIPDGIVSLAAIGEPDQTLRCDELYQSGLEGLLFRAECDALIADTTIPVTCGCSVTAPATPVTPAPVAATPAPFLATPAPVLTTAAPVVTTPAPVITTPAPAVAPVTQAPILPTPPIPTAVTQPPSRRAPYAASQRVPNLPEMPVGTTRNGNRPGKPRTKPSRNKPVVRPRTNRQRPSNPTRSHPRHNVPSTIDRTPNPTKIRPKHPNYIPMSGNDDDSMTHEAQALDNVLTTSSLSAANYHHEMEEPTYMKQVAAEMNSVEDLPQLLVALDYTNIYKRQASLLQKYVET